MTHKQYTCCLVLLLFFGPDHILKGSELPASTKTIVLTTGACLFGGLLLWKRAYIAHYFLSKIFKPDSPDKKTTVSHDIHEHHMQCLMSAINSGDTNTVKTLLQNPDIDPDKSNGDSKDTPLHIACDNNNKEIVQLLLNDKRTDPNIKNREGQTALHKACRYQDKNSKEEIITLLLNDKRTNPNLAANMEHYDYDRYTSLHMACQSNYINTVQLLLSHDQIDPNIQTNKYKPSSSRSPLRIAIEKGYTAIIQLLLNHPKIDPNILICQCINHSRDQNNIEIAKLLLDHPKTNHDNINFTFLHSNKNVKFIKLFLSYPEINLNIDSDYPKILKKKTWTTYTPLAMACRDKDIPMINLLLAHPTIDLNALSSDGQTPLMISLELKTENPKTAITKLLLNDPRTDPNKAGAEETKPLLATIKNGHLKQIHLLFNHPQIKRALKNNEYSQEERNETFLYFCYSYRSSTDMAIKLFDAFNIDLKKCDTALHMACHIKNLDLLHFLLTKEPNVHTKNDMGCTPLLVAAHGENLDMIKLLLAHGAHLSDEGESHRNVIYLAHKVLTDQELAHPNPKEFFTKELHKACSIVDDEVKQKSFIQWCQDKGADLNARNSNNERAVDIVARELHLMQQIVPFRSSELIHKEKIYHHLLHTTPYYPDEKLYAILNMHLSDPDVSKTIMAHYKFLTIDRDIAQQTDYKYEKVSNTQKNRFKRDLFTKNYKGLLSYLPPIEKLSFS